MLLQITKFDISIHTLEQTLFISTQHFTKLLKVHNGYQFQVLQI